MRGQGTAVGPHPGWAPPGWVPAGTVDPPRSAVDRPTMVIDFGADTAAAMVVTEQGSWLVPDPTSGEARWPCAIHWDGQRMVAGAAAVHGGETDPAGYRAGLRRALVDEEPVVLGLRPRSPVEAVAEFLAAMRNVAGRLLTSPGGSPGQPHWTPPDRAVVTVPATASPALRGRLVEAAELAGFLGVELIPEPAAAVWAAGRPLRPGELVLVYDAGASVDATLVRIAEGRPEVLGSSVDGHPGGPEPGSSGQPGVNGQSGIDGQSDIDVSPLDGTPGVGDLSAAASGGIDRALAGGRDLLARLGVSPAQVSWVAVVGGRARVPGLGARIEHGLGLAAAVVDEPELAVLRGAAAWLAHSGSRCVPARGSDQRLVPLAYTIPGYTARLLRWLVEPRQPYAEGAVVARVRLATGAVWDLTVRTSGVLDEVLVPAGRDIRSGEWLALVRPA